MANTKIKMFDSAAGYDLAAGVYDNKEKYLNSFEKNKVVPLLGDVTGQSLLDVGAGTGRLTTVFVSRGAKVTALDVSPAMLNILQKKTLRRVEVVVGNAEELPFLAESFDWVVAAFLVVHLKDPRYFFEEAYRVLRVGGRLLVTNINQKEAPPVHTAAGIIKIDSYYHRPEKIRSTLEELAFSIKEELIVKEGEQWVNQIIVAEK
jgi:ubiquinone/menaquinone biosynthesis C-methylase UbiE